MRSGVKRTPKATHGSSDVANESIGEALSAEKISGKKLVQARLPFKTITPSGSGGAAAATVAQKTTETRKRKLSYDDKDGSSSSANSDVEIAECSKENIKISASATTKKLKTLETSVIENGNKTATEEDDYDDCVVLLSDTDNDDDKAVQKSETKGIHISINAILGKKTPLSQKKQTPSSTGKTTKGARTPKQTTLGGDTPKSANSAQNTKNKRRKSMRNLKAKEAENKKKNQKTTATAAEVESTDDDIEFIAEDLNPQKRAKLDDEVSENECETKIKTKSNEGVAEGVEKPQNKSGNHKNDNKTTKLEEEQEQHNENSNQEEPNTLKRRPNLNETIDSVLSESSTLDEEEADDEADISTATATTKKETQALNKSTTSIKSAKSDGKLLTPKQMKLQEQRRKAREEKEQKLQEEKMQKQREKEARELAKKREREEKEEQRRLEREEKEEQKRVEREAKERKRLEELEAKNEEKRKRNEAREEEQRKKDDEKRRKEQEKEEAEQKKKRAAAAFTKFFVPKTPTIGGGANGANGNNVGTEGADVLAQTNGNVDVSKLAFAPFQIKGDMKLAPLLRKVLNEEQRAQLDGFMGAAELQNSNEEESIIRRKPVARTQLYLAQLAAGKITPGKWRRPTIDTKVDDEVQVIEDDLERVGLAIIDEQKRATERLRAKFLKFTENRRPAYYGTWRKQSKVVTARRPFGQDSKFFDYEVDSDCEWEEEEPGESLDGSDDEKDKESEEDDYEVDNEWFVPHGHLSDEELQNEDELGGDDNMREAQKAKLQLLQQEFAQEMKKETKKIKPRLIGCIWLDTNGQQPNDCPNIIWETLNKRAMICHAPISLEEPKLNEALDADSDNDEQPQEKKLKPLVLADKDLQDLARLVHGNNHSKAFLVNEYLAYLGNHVQQIKSNDVLPPTKTLLREKIEEFAEWKIVEANVAESTTKKTKKPKKRLCWIVNDEVLTHLDLTSLTLDNNWTYTLKPKFVKDTKLNETVGVDTPEAMTTNADKTEKVSTTDSAASVKPKKRVQLLMSVPRGEQIPITAKNALISQFLKKSTNEVMKDNYAEQESIKDDDDIIVLN